VVLAATPAAADPARVIVDGRTGTVVMTADVRIGRVAVSPRTRVQVDEGGGNPGRLVVIEENASLGELVARLNRLKLSPGELIRVLQAIKAAGALQAEIVVR